MLGKLLPDEMIVMFFGTNGAHKARLSRTNNSFYHFDSKDQSQYCEAIVKMLLGEPAVHVAAQL